MAAADPGVLATAAALRRPGHRAAAGRRAAAARGGLAALPGARVLSIAPRRGGRVPRRRVAPRRRARRWRTRAARRARSASLFVYVLGRAVTRAWSPTPARRAARRSAGRDRVPSRVPGRPLSRALGRGLRRASAGGASSPGSRCSGSRRRRACSRCTLSPAHAGLTPHVRDVRGWAVAGPLLISPRWSTLRGRVAEVAAVVRPAAIRHRRRSPLPVLRAPSGARVRHGDRRTPPRSLHRDGAVRAARSRVGAVLAAGHRRPRRAARARLGRRWPRTTGWSSSAFRCLPPPRICWRVIWRSRRPARPSRRWPSRSRRFISRTPPIIRTSRRRNGCRCTCSRCGDVSTTPTPAAVGFLGAATSAVTLSNFYGGLIAAVDHPGRRRGLLARSCAGADARARCAGWRITVGSLVARRRLRDRRTRGMRPAPSS